MEGLTVPIGAVPGSETVAPEMPQNSTCSTTFVSGWHAREASDSGWLRWSSGTGRLRISATTEADFELSGDVVSSVRPNTIDVRIDGKAAATWVVTDPAWACPRGDARPLSRGGGTHRDSGPSGPSRPVTSPTDPRPLAIAVKDLTLRRLDRADPCAVRF